MPRSTTRRRPCLAVLASASLVTACVPPASWQAPAPPLRPDWEVGLPPPDEPGLPAAPARSPRTASYRIEARLDPKTHRIDGSAVLTWRNDSSEPQDSFPFHLYWNAFRNNLSTFARGERRRKQPPTPAGDVGRVWGFIDVRAAALLEDDGTRVDLMPSLRYEQPDDDNTDDRTVARLTTPRAVPPGATARFAFKWTARIPYGDRGRAGWVHDYHFIAQWFPKIGVLRNGRWNCHQFHANSEFFADYGDYDVRLTLPAGLVVGATGRLQDKTPGEAGTETWHFVQEDVHDFAWAASRRFVERTARFESPGYPPVDLRLLLQPEHVHYAERYLEAARVALRIYGAWGLPYPYGHLTIVDPAWNSGSGGMEYPALITGGVGLVAPPGLQSPEAVTIHEVGHQVWYGLVGSNEFEEAWLDEGINQYCELRARWRLYGGETWAASHFGLPESRRSGWPVVAPGVILPREGGELESLRAHGTEDPMVRRAWEYLTPRGYTLNAYGKPALTLFTLEGLVGRDTMDRILRTYARRHAYAHPTTDDLIAAVAEVTGQDYGWFFDQTLFGSELLDYAVSVRQDPPRIAKGFVDGPDGRPVEATAAVAVPDRALAEVTLRRLGGMRMPVELRVEFSDGRQVIERWDGTERWIRYRYEGPARVVRAVVDPEHRLALDIDPSNGEWVEERGLARRAALKWTARWMLWLQSLLEMQMVLS